jgi:iron complex outermembrane receptor protein
MIPRQSRITRVAGSRLLGVGLAALLAAPFSFAQNAPASAPSANEETLKLSAFEVTGSRIRRVDSEGPLPIVQLSRSEFDGTGYTTAADFLRDLPFNAGGNIDPQRTSTFATGATTANLRGLGSRNTLVLINGRRIAGYGLPGGNGFSTVFDLSAIPTAAIEAIELLKDGASAIYGSDAVAGVINIKTRKNFSGLNTELFLGNTTDTDSLERRLGLTFGATTEKTELVVVADYSSRNALKQADREVAANADSRRFGGRDNRSSAGFPGRVTVPGLGTVTYNAPTTTPTVAGAVPYNGFVHSYNFSPITDNIPTRDAYGAYVWAKHQMTDNLYAFTELMTRTNKSLIEVAAVPVFGQNEQGSSAAGQMLFPATNPFNPFGVNIAGSALAFRLTELGPRSTDIQSDATRFLAGLGGNLNANWTWEAAVMHSENKTSQANFNQGFDRLIQNALNGIVGPQTGRQLWLNPFGPNDPELLRYLNSNYNRLSSFKTRIGDLNVSGKLLDLPAGDLGFAAGVETRTEKLVSWRSLDEQTGQVTGGSEGFNTFADRKVQSAYAELSAPLFTGAEIQLAGRFEDYSDFGKTTKPKVALSFRPTPWLLLRGSFSQSFKAPDLAQLYNGGTVSFTAGNVVDPRRPTDPARQLKIVTVGNPALQPEETDTFYVGFVFEPGKKLFNGALEGFSMTVDFFNFDGTDVIAQFGGTVILNNELVSPIFGNRVVRAVPTAADIAAGLPGALINVNDSFQNVSTQTYKGVDVGARYEWRTQNLGRFAITADVTYTDSIDFGGVEFIDSFTYPRFRANARLSWSKGDWAASVYANHIAGYDDVAFATASLGGNGLLNRIQEWTVVNPQISYRGFHKYLVTLGARNVFDNQPEQSYGASEGYDNLTHNAEGRFVYLRISRDW